MHPPASDLWRNGAFVRFWTGRSISIFGSLITRMALPFVYGPGVQGAARAVAEVSRDEPIGG